MLSARGSSHSRNGSRSTSRTVSREREIPKRSELVDYNYAVAGHAGTLCDADGELFIKPCTQSEIDFYELARAEHEDFYEWMPLCYGSLSLTETTDAVDISAQIPAIVEQAPVPAAVKEHVQSHLQLERQASLLNIPVAQPAVKDNVTWIPNKNKMIKTDRAVVLENAAYGFKQPNIMDTKLGVRLWADDAPLQKRERFDKIASETTHKNFGFRVAGMRAYKGSEDSSELDSDDYKIYDKDWGRLDINEDNVETMLRKFIFNDAAGIDEESGKFIAAAFVSELERIREVLESNETRMYSSSLLFVFEGDGESLRTAIDEMRIAMKSGSKSGHAGSRVDSGIGMDDDAEDPELVTDSDEDEELSLSKIFTVKLIDFAHANWVPGQGPDENILLGVRSLSKLFESMSR